MDETTTLDDLLAMEHSCFQAFIAPEQADVLLLMWDIQERGDNEEFDRKFVVDMDPESMV